MWPCLVVFSDPHVHISLQFVDWTIYLFAERNTIELVERGLVEAFTDAVRLRALGLGARVIDVLDRKIQLILVPFGVAAELAAAVSQHAQELDIVLLEEWQHAVIEQIGRRDGRLAVIELGKAYLGIGVDEGLLVDASNALQVADIERILGAAVTWMLALELAVRLLLGLGLFQRDDLRLGQHQALLGALGFHGADDLLFSRHGVLQSAEAGRFATPTASRPASACDSPWGQDTSARLSFS